ncbi:MAG: UDP-N-acetylmuramoyl-tripeptide--D-alanyl-D-alanine ligase [Gaiellaceae bacterium]
MKLVEGLGRLIRRPGYDELTGVTIDSRRVAEGDLFVAVRGGVDFVNHALARGAAAVLVPHDAHAALAHIGGAVRERSEARFVGITGSYGKTTTKDILAAFCSPHARTVAAEGSYNAELGVPLTLCRVEADTEICVLELAMRGRGQLAALASFARPQIGVITNIGPVHLGLLGSLEAIAEAKAELLSYVEEAVLPDEPLLAPFVPAGLPVRPFSPDDVLSFAGGRAVFRFEGEELPLQLDLAMEHNAVNALAALHAYAALGLPLDRVGEGAAKIELSRWHGEELPLAAGGVLIADCWNANPVSMRATLDHAVRVAAGRRVVAVLGGMAELGPETSRYHAEVASYLGELGVVDVIAVGELARPYGGTWVASPAEAIAALSDVLQPGDVVLVKGSRSVGLEAVAENWGH